MEEITLEERVDAHEVLLDVIIRRVDSLAKLSFCLIGTVPVELASLRRRQNSLLGKRVEASVKAGDVETVKAVIDSWMLGWETFVVCMQAVVVETHGVLSEELPAELQLLGNAALASVKEELREISDEVCNDQRWLAEKLEQAKRAERLRDRALRRSQNGNDHGKAAGRA